MYVSLSEIQIKDEEEASNRPFTKVLITKNRKILWCKIMTVEILYESTAEDSIKLSGIIENGGAISRLYIFVWRTAGGSPVEHSP